MLNLIHIRMLALVGFFAVTSWASTAGASCDLFPGVERTYSSSLGSANRPWAAPGESIVVKHRVCDGGGAATEVIGADNLVTVAFLEPGMTGASLVVLSDDCDAGLQARVDACGTGNAID